MTPDVAKIGHSFRGAFAYYLHDKAAPGEEKRQTAERVAWVETRNLALDDPAFAQSVMIATARNADQLKASAGIKAGRKATAGPVYAYSLSWHPDKEAPPDRAEMIRAVDASLKALQADHLQAVIVCHQDRAHPHVHVILNRVDPATGRMHATGNDYRKLSAWAAAYERERGQIVTPARQEKYGLDAQQEPARQPSKPEPQGKSREKSLAAQLAARGTAQAEQHRQDWKDLAAANKARRGAIYDATTAAMKAAAARHRTDSRPTWSKLFREKRAARQAFDYRETYIGGIVATAIMLAANRPIKGDGSDRGLLSTAFAYTISRDRRREAFDTHWQRARQQTAAQVKEPLDRQVAGIKAARAAELENARRTFDLDRAALIARQTLERAEIRMAWRELNEHRQRPRSYAEMTPQQQERQAMKKEFGKAAELASANLPSKPGPTVDVSLSVPIPAPSPAGDVPPVKRRAHSVPDVDKATQTSEPKQTPSPAREWTRAAPPPSQTAKDGAAPEWKQEQERRPVWKPGRGPEQGPSKNQ